MSAFASLSLDFLTCETSGIIWTLLSKCDSRRKGICKYLVMTGEVLTPGQQLKDEMHLHLF